MRLGARVGRGCAELHDRMMVGLRAGRLELDEIWGYVGKKQKRVQRHYSTIWRKCLYKAFLAGGGKPRKYVHARFNALRRFRNRIAHHEPVFHRAIKVTHIEIIEAIGWMCKQTASWADHHSRFEDVS